MLNACGGVTASLRHITLVSPLPQPAPPRGVRCTIPATKENARTINSLSELVNFSLHLADVQAKQRHPCLAARVNASKIHPLSRASKTQASSLLQVHCKLRAKSNQVTQEYLTLELHDDRSDSLDDVLVGLPAGPRKSKFELVLLPLLPHLRVLCPETRAVHPGESAPMEFVEKRRCCDRVKHLDTFNKRNRSEGGARLVGWLG